MVSLDMADLFCGGGGTSAGAHASAGRFNRTLNLYGVNHDTQAIETFRTNHPLAEYACVNVDSIDVARLVAGRKRPFDILWASPACTHHSKARGGKPMDDQSRATAWCVVRWAEVGQPKVILIENVAEFLNWGPVGLNGKPIKSKRGTLFRLWVTNLEALGYRVEYRILCAADYGAPTTRERLIIQAVRGRRKIVWPERTHAPAEELASAQGDFLTGGLKPWLSARDHVIDWSIKGTSIFTRPKPLADKTLQRIFIGLLRYGLAGAVVAWDNQSGPGTWSTARPVTTIVTKERHGVATPYLISLRGTGADQIPSTARCVDLPLQTISAGGVHAGLLEPMLLGQQGGASARPVSQPTPTVATAGVVRVAQPFLLKYYGTATASSIDEPTHTVTCKERFGLVEILLKHCRDNPGKLPVITVDGVPYALDILFRTLRWPELAKAQGFPAGYQFTGKTKHKVKQIGNAVPPPLAEALINAQLQAGNI